MHSFRVTPRSLPIAVGGVALLFAFSGAVIIAVSPPSAGPFAGCLAVKTNSGASTTKGQIYNVALSATTPLAPCLAGDTQVTFSNSQGPIGPAGPVGSTGATGPQGSQGLPGSPGTNGRSVLNGTGAPLTTAGSDGDFYIDTTNERIFGPKVAGAWPIAGVSLVGTAGSNGINGKSVLNGVGAPAATVGADGDFYLDMANAALYGPKAAGGWSAGVSIVGPRGPQGPVGPAGPPGPLAEGSVCQSVRILPVNSTTSSDQIDCDFTVTLSQSGELLLSGAGEAAVTTNKCDLEPYFEANFYVDGQLVGGMRSIAGNNTEYSFGHSYAAVAGTHESAGPHAITFQVQPKCYLGQAGEYVTAYFSGMISAWAVEVAYSP